MVINKSRVMLEFDKFVNVNLGRLNRYEEEFKKEIFKNNKENVNRSHTPINIKNHKLNPKILKNSVPPSILLNDKSAINKEFKKKVMSNLNFIKKEDVVKPPITKINVIKKTIKKEKESNKNELKNKVKLEVPSTKIKSEIKKIINKNSNNLKENFKNSGNEITLTNDNIKPIKIHSEENEKLSNSIICDQYNKIHNDINVFNPAYIKLRSYIYVSKLISFISVKLNLQQFEIEKENNRIIDSETKKLSDIYISKILFTVKNYFKNQIKIDNENNKRDKLFLKVSSCFMNSVFENIKFHFKKHEAFEHSIKNNEYSINTVELKDKIVRNSKIERKINNNSLENTKNQPPNPKIFRNSLSNRKNSKINEKTVNKIQKKYSVQQNNLINYTSIDKNIHILETCKTDFNDEIKDSKISHFIDCQEEIVKKERKKSVFKKEVRHSISQKKNNENNNELLKTHESENNTLFINRDDNLHRNNKLTQVHNQLNSLKEDDKPKNEKYSSKSIDRLNKVRSKARQKTVSNDKSNATIQLKGGVEFQQKVENLSKFFSHVDSVNIPVTSKKNSIKNTEIFISSTNLNEGNSEESHLQLTLERPTIMVAKKTKIQFN